MVQIVGKYQHVSNSPEFEDYLKSLGAPEDIVRQFADSKPSVTISEAAGQWTLQVSNAGKESSSTFRLGEVYDEPTPLGLVFKSVTRREGDKFITESSVEDGKKGTRIYEFSDAGFIVRLVEEKTGKKATREYKRV